MDIILMTPALEKRIREKALVIAEAMTQAPLLGSPRTLMSEWTLALMHIAAELVVAAPESDRGQIVDELQTALLQFVKSKRRIGH